MKQLLVLSGKGGTGKTTVVASFIELMKAKAFADCDVDAPNLHLVTSAGNEDKRLDYFGMDKSYINQDLCVGCGECMKYCRFDAIECNEGTYSVNPYACEGCSVCAEICPVDAIEMTEDIAGEIKVFRNDSVFTTATLKMGSGTSGKLVISVKQTLKKEVDEEAVDMAVIDGSPGIGCPVIASVSGVDMVLVVTEPTVSGISDMKRVLEVSNHFKIKSAICVNKYDVNRDKANEIKMFASEAGIPFVGVIPYDTMVAKATNAGRNVIEYDCPAGRHIKEIYEATMALI